jgi:hypothetical protein
LTILQNCAVSVFGTLFISCMSFFLLI